MIRFSAEVKEALAEGLATVALETSVVAQGLPFRPTSRPRSLARRRSGREELFRPRSA